MIKGKSIDMAIVIDAKDTVDGLSKEHRYISQLLRKFDCDIDSIEQNLIIADGKEYDQFNIKMEDGSEQVLFFDVTSFFGKTY